MGALAPICTSSIYISTYLRVTVGAVVSEVLGPFSSMLAPCWLHVGYVAVWPLGYVAVWPQGGLRLAQGGLMLAPSWPHVGSSWLKLASCWLKLSQVGLMLAQVGLMLASSWVKSQFWRQVGAM